MPATSPYLNRPLRPLVIAIRDILAARIGTLKAAENRESLFYVPAYQKRMNRFSEL